MKLCKCGKEKSTEKSVYCRDCSNAYQVAVRLKRRTSGLCNAGCNNVADAGVYCKDCSNKRKPAATLAATLRRKQRRANGLCLQCGKEFAGVYCAECKVLRNNNAAAQYALYKTRCVELFDSKCADCGLVSEYTEVYDFHHLDPSKKDFSIAKLLSGRTWAKIAEELKKCVMICSNCHRIRHAKEEYVR